MTIEIWLFFNIKIGNDYWNMIVFNINIANDYWNMIVFNIITLQRTSVFHWNVTIWLVMKWSHDYKRDVLHPNKTQTWTCMCLHDDVRCKQSMA